MGTPQIIYICITALGLLVAANKHGKPKEGNESFWITFTAVIIGYSLLIWGGFFA